MVTVTARQRILVVEDEEPIARLLQRYLESVGFDVHREGSGAAALGYAAEHRPDLVILDLRLPDVHGYDVCKGLRRLYHAWVVPIMMLTGMDTPLDKLRGFSYGADAYLTKPFEPPALLPTIELLLGRTEQPA